MSKKPAAKITGGVKVDKRVAKTMQATAKPAAGPEAADDIMTDAEVYAAMKAPRPPSVGRTVIFRQGILDNLTGRIEDASWQGTNGTRDHPAIITRVWTGDCVNLMVMFDGHTPCAVTSVCELPMLDDASYYKYGTTGWRWPDRV